MPLHLVRHAHAEDRDAWSGPDDARPLTGRGRRRAEELAAELAPLGVDLVLSSPARRCIDTVAPLAAAVGVEVVPTAALAEGAPLEETWALLESLQVGDRHVVACSHGDVLPPVLDRLARRGAVISGSARRVTKGSVWTVAAGADGHVTTPAALPD
jgi:8-oxo-dGTP diphosphatase